MSISTTTQILEDEYNLKALNVFFNGVIYIGTIEQCQTVQQVAVGQHISSLLLEKLFGEIEKTHKDKSMPGQAGR